MYPSRSGLGHKGQYVHRTSHRDEYSDEYRRRDGHSAHHDYKYPEDPPSRREYDRSPQRSYATDDVNRDRNRNNPTRRRSPISERNRRPYLDDYSGRRSPDDGVRHHPEDGVRKLSSQEDTFRHRHSSPRRWPLETESTRTSRHKESTHRRSPECFPEKESYGNRRSEERISNSHSSSYSNRTERDKVNWDPRQYPTHQKGPSGELLENDLDNQPGVEPAKTNASKGFQKFLEILNKGVNVDTLTRIVKVTAPKEARSESASACQENWLYPTKATLERTSLDSDDRRDARCSSRPAQALISENGIPAHGGQTKHRELQDVLQAIGLDLGFDELGQMSDRIQERLYGRKEVGECGRRGGRDSRSSSSNRSGFMPHCEDDSYQDVLRDRSDAVEDHTRRTVDGSNKDYHVNNPPKCPDFIHTAIPFLTQTPQPRNTCPPFPPPNPRPEFCRPPPPFSTPLRFIPPPTSLSWRPAPPPPPPFSYPPVTQSIVPPPQCPPTPQQANAYSRPASSLKKSTKPPPRLRCLQVVNIKE